MVNVGFLGTSGIGKSSLSNIVPREVFCWVSSTYFSDKDEFDKEMIYTDGEVILLPDYNTSTNVNTLHTKKRFYTIKNASFIILERYTKNEKEGFVGTRKVLYGRYSKNITIKQADDYALLYA